MRSYTIMDNRGTQAEILPEKGATVISFCRNGVEFLYRDQKNLDSAERPRCGIPFLFPVFGRLKDGKYTWEDGEFAMEIHGFGHTSAWQVVRHTDDTLVLTLEDDERIRKQYPFAFRVTLTFRVCDGALTIHQSYENRDSRAMPYNYGFHPYFLTERLEDIRVETEADTLFDFVAGGRAFGHGSVKLTMPEGAPETGAAFMGVKGPTVLHNASRGWKLTMEFDESIHTHVLWAQAGKGFLCVEPVNGTADGLNMGKYLTLAPGEKRESFVTFRGEIL